MGNVSDSRPDVRVAAWAARQWGVLSLDELRRCGLSRKAVARRARSGHLHRLHRGVYAVGHPNPPLEGRFLAAVRACGPAAVLSHHSAAAMTGLLKWDGRALEVTVPSGTTRVHPGIRVHRSATLRREDVTRRGALLLTSVERTLVDLAASLPYRPLRRAVREALGTRQTDLASLLATVERLRPRRGITALAKILAGRLAPTRTVLEDVVLDLILAGGFEHPDVNAPMRIAGRRLVPDFRWPRQRVIVEADGGDWHDHPIAREDDAERQALLEASGERLVRVTWQQAVSRRHETLARIRAAGAPIAE